MKRRNIKDVFNLTEDDKIILWMYKCDIDWPVSYIKRTGHFPRFKGTWNSGTWLGGYFMSGIWKDGVWKNGIFYDGNWISGTWEDGTWYNGNWREGEWKSGIWHAGLIWDPKKKKYVESFKSPKDCEWSLSYEKG